MNRDIGMTLMIGIVLRNELCFDARSSLYRQPAGKLRKRLRAIWSRVNSG
jgi:hypothetical protein